MCIRDRITGEAAREDTQRWRARASAILTGIGTVLDDDPRMDVRSVPTPRQPIKVVLDSHWRTPPQARLLASAGPVWVMGLASADPDLAARQSALQAAGAELLAAPATAAGQVDLAWLLPELARRGVNELHVEAGARLNGHLIEQGWVDEILVYLAPKLLGPGRGLAALSPLTALDGCWQGDIRDLTQVGHDVRLLVRPAGRERF